MQSFSAIMFEFTYDLDPESKAGETEGENERDTAFKRCVVRLCKALKKTGDFLATPVNDCRRRSHPRIVPDYSLLVLVSCVANPLLGALVCFLHRQAKKLFHKGEKRQADVVYVLVFALALLSVGSTLLCVSLVGSYHLIHDFSRENIQRSKPSIVCLFREADDRQRKELNLSRNDYCRRLQALRGTGEGGMTNTTTVIDLLGAWIRRYHQSQNKSAV